MPLVAVVTTTTTRRFLRPAVVLCKTISIPRGAQCNDVLRPTRICGCAHGTVCLRHLLADTARESGSRDRRSCISGLVGLAPKVICFSEQFFEVNHRRVPLATVSDRVMHEWSQRSSIRRFTFHIVDETLRTAQTNSMSPISGLGLAKARWARNASTMQNLTKV